jgi:hypothetical protein
VQIDEGKSGVIPPDSEDPGRDGHARALRGLPAGHFRLELVTFLKGQEPHIPFITSTQRRKAGYSLERLRDLLGGDEGALIDPLGGSHSVSLEPYLGHDRERLRIIPRFVFEPDD